MYKYLKISYYLKNYNNYKHKIVYYLNKNCLDNPVNENNIIFKNFSKELNIQNYKKNLQVYNTVLDILTSKLNKIHKVNFSKKFWETIIGWWLIEHIKINIEAWMKIKSINENNLTHFYFIDFPDYETKLYDCEDSINKFKSNKWSQFNYQRWTSNICQSLIKKKIEYSDNKNIKILIKNNFKNIIKNFVNLFLYIYNNYKSNFKKNIIFVNHFFTHERFSKINKRNTIYETKNYYHVKINRNKFKSYDKILRNSILETFKNDDSFEQTYYKFLVDDLPIIFLEDFYKFLSLSLKKFNFRYSKLVLTSQSHFFDSNFKFSIAYNREKFDTKLYLIQHGGSYFCSKLHTHFFWEQRIADIFFTWGKAESKSNIKYLGVNRINKIENDPNYVLIVLDGIIRTYSDYLIPNSEFLFDYLNEIIELITNIENKYKIIVRLPRRNKIFYKKYLLSKKTNIIFDKNKKASDSYKKAELVISCAFATSALETIYNNIPTIIFIPEYMNNYYHKKIKDLYDNSIFFEKIDEVSKFLLNDQLKITNWWFSSTNQSIIQKFNNNYCLENLNLFNEFNKYIEK